jgi:hypothetical protein
VLEDSTGVLLRLPGVLMEAIAMTIYYSSLIETPGGTRIGEGRRNTQSRQILQIRS